MIRLAGSWIGIGGFMDREFEDSKVPAERALTKALLLTERAIKKKLTGRRTGRVYIIDGRRHVASAPGEPPATLYGDLRKSITHVGPFWERDILTGEVGSDLPKANMLEYGGITSNGARILPRPFLEPVMLEEEGRIDAALEGALEP